MLVDVANCRCCDSYMVNLGHFILPLHFTIIHGSTRVAMSSFLFLCIVDCEVGVRMGEGLGTRLIYMHSSCQSHSQTRVRSLGKIIDNSLFIDG